MITVPISLGELYDKISILEIKMSKIIDADKLNNISNELEMLKTISALHPINEQFYIELKSINQGLWKIEDDIRDKERKNQFDDEFINLARRVYMANDKRSQIKKNINQEYNSDIIEEKSYNDY